MTPIERGVQALAVSLEAGDSAALDAESRRKFAGAVRAVLEAVREPDQLMMESGAEIVRYVGNSESDEAYRDDAANIWRSMVAAVLAEG